MLRGVVATLSLGVFTMVGAGCRCTLEEKVWDRIFPTYLPEHSVGRFCAYLETGDWPRAYDLLSSGSRDEVPYTLFRIGTPFAEDPRTGIPVLEMILGACGSRKRVGGHPLEPKIERVQVSYTGVDRDGKDVLVWFHVVLVDESEEGSDWPDWKIDLLKTVESIPRE